MVSIKQGVVSLTRLRNITSPYHQPGRAPPVDIDGQLTREREKATFVFMYPNHAMVYYYTLNALDQSRDVPIPNPPRILFPLLPKPTFQQHILCWCPHQH